MAQAKARNWPWLAYLFRFCSAAGGVKADPLSVGQVKVNDLSKVDDRKSIVCQNTTEHLNPEQSKVIDRQATARRKFTA